MPVIECADDSEQRGGSLIVYHIHMPITTMQRDNTSARLFSAPHVLISPPGRGLLF